ncbi:MAG: cation transporter [Chloroflexi bacterium]|nr:cation transporter [Chloroflexota bacterium]
MFSTPIGAARLFLAVVITLIGLKIAVGLITGSISIWAQAADSCLDLLAAVITYITVGFSVKPADNEHPFGHGKVEDIAAGLQTVLLLGTAGSIIYAAVRRIITGSPIELTEAGIGVMFVSMITSILLSRHIFRVVRATGSVALEANAHMLNSDIYSNAGVMIGLAVVRFTGLNIIDPILALMVSALILRTSYKVGRTAFGRLIDTKIPAAEEQAIISCIMEHRHQLVGFHAVRTRTAGSQRFIDLHLVMPKNASVEESHRMCDHLEQDIKDKLPNPSITIHVEPCDLECEQCFVFYCNQRIEKTLEQI